MEQIAAPDAPAGTSEAVLTAATGRGATAAARADLFSPIAMVDAVDLEDLFRKTNAIDGPWTGAPGVDAVAPELRSTSMGDIAYDIDADIVSECAMIGWTAIDDSDARAAIRERSQHRERPQTP